ncbi:MAG: flagellar hook-associated protein FlgL [Acidobacteria bacterium]|nr:flagellar hook-associated protein FlgL [Acidobacteriota bacterium]MBI3657029.1 flagellar hook-associated protein FlgL [Acidobacteriota bacterium]
MSIDRIVSSISYRDFLEDLSATRRRIETASREVSSARRINFPSDDPTNISNLLQVKDALAQLDQFGRNAGAAKALLSFTDSLLDSAVNLMNVVVQRGVAAATDTQSVQSRRAAGDEITVIRDQILNLANSSFQGSYIFGGQQSSTPPFAISGGVVTYNGDSGVNLVDIGPGLSSPTNIPGNQVFTISGNDLFAALGNLITALKTPAPSPPGPTQTVQITTAMATIARSFEQFRTTRAQIGSYLGVVDRAKQLLDNQRLHLVSSISAIEDTNMADSIANLVREQTVESATLGVGARIPRRTLFDFIG